MHFDMAALENGANLDGEWLATGIALVNADASALAFQFTDALGLATTRADRIF